MSDIVIIYPGQRVSLAPTASAFAHGFGLFETMRYAEGRLYFWQDHWARLARSAKHFSLVLPEQSEVQAALRELVASSKLEAGTLKLSLLKEGTNSRLYVYARPPLPAPEGRCLRFDPSCPICPSSILSGHKTHNYMEVMHLLSLARAQGYFDVLRTDLAGNLAETTTSNLFFVKDGRVHTPALDVGILPGVIRAALVGARELEVEEGTFAPEALLGAEVVFVSNATCGLQVVERIDGLESMGAAVYADTCEALSRAKSVLVRLQAERAYQLI
jgi:branched-subunit amino acid aminotransferase/4-amino-4-deoxychorismate lyase